MVVIVGKRYRYGDTEDMKHSWIVIVADKGWWSFCINSIRLGVEEKVGLEVGVEPVIILIAILVHWQHNNIPSKHRLRNDLF